MKNRLSKEDVKALFDKEMGENSGQDFEKVIKSAGGFNEFVKGMMLGKALSEIFDDSELSAETKESRKKFYRSLDIIKDIMKKDIAPIIKRLNELHELHGFNFSLYGTFNVCEHSHSAVIASHIDSKKGHLGKCHKLVNVLLSKESEQTESEGASKIDL